MGPDGNLWFTESDGNQIGRILVNAPNTITEFAIPAHPRQICGDLAHAVLRESQQSVRPITRTGSAGAGVLECRIATPRVSPDVPDERAYLRPAFGFFPWLALLRRDFSLRLLVFLLIERPRLADQCGRPEMSR